MDWEKEKTLKDFIEENHKLISVLGIMVAITTFSYNLPLKSAGYILSFIFLSISLVLWIELIKNFPKDPKGNLAYFSILINWAIMGVLGYWVLAYRLMFQTVSFLICFIAILFAMSKIIPPLLEKVWGINDGKNRIRKKVIGFIYLIVFSIITYYLTRIVSPYVNYLLDLIWNHIKNLDLKIE